GGGLRAADALLLPGDFASGGRGKLDGAQGRRLAAAAAVRLPHHDDARQPCGAAADQHEAAAGILEYRAGGVRADGIRRAVERRDSGDAVLPVCLLCNGCGRVPGGHDRGELDRARGYGGIPRAGVARRNSSGTRTDYIPFLTDRDSADDWLHWKVLSAGGGDSRSILHTGYCRNTQLSSVAVLLLEADSDDVLRAAARRRRHGALRGVELRVDGSAGVRDDRVRAVLVADHLVRGSVAEFFHRPCLIGCGDRPLLEDDGAVVVEEHLLPEVGAYGLCQDHHFQVLAFAREVGDGVAVRHRGGCLGDYRAGVELFGHVVRSRAD